MLPEPIISSNSLGKDVFFRVEAALRKSQGYEVIKFVENNRLIREKPSWAPSMALKEGLQRTYPWIEEQVRLWQAQTAHEHETIETAM